MSSEAEYYKTDQTEVRDDIVQVLDSAKVNPADISGQDGLSFRYRESQKMGITGAVFVVLNKMI